MRKRAGRMYGGEIECLQDMVDKLELKRPLGKLRHRWENIKLDLKEF
jgi:hypothetical protein